MNTPVKPRRAAGTAKAETSEESAFREIRRAYRKLDRAIYDIIHDHNLSETQFSALRALRRAGPHGLPCSEITQQIAGRVPDITRLVDRLAKAGLVERCPCPEDRRVIWVKLTDAGRGFLKKIDKPLAEHNARQFSRLTGTELTTLVDLLRKVNATDAH